MINKRQKFPPALEAALAGHSVLDTYTPPANRGECPKDLASHPATYAISLLQSGNIPPGIIAAVNDPKNGWTKSGGSAPPGKSATPPGKPAAAAQGKAAVPPANKPAASQAKAPVPAPKAKVANAPRGIYARTAYPEGVMFDRQLFGRDADPEAFSEESDLFARDADPSAFSNDDSDLYGRDAEPSAFYSDASDLHARAAKNALGGTRPSSYPSSHGYSTDPNSANSAGDDFGTPVPNPLSPSDARPMVVRAIPDTPSPSSSSSHHTDIQPIPHVSSQEIQDVIRTLVTNPQAQ